eukprot:Polyplicarium_translucidae@DN3400_c0_g2_i4.p1
MKLGLLLGVVVAGQQCNDIFTREPQFDYDIFVFQDEGMAQTLLRAIEPSIMELFDAVMSDNTVSNRMGMAAFTDIPVAPMGGPGDSCNRGGVSGTANRDAFSSFVSGLREGDLGDPPGSQLHTLMQIVDRDFMGWRPDILHDDRPKANIVLLVTNRPFHVAGDAAVLAPGADFSPMNVSSFPECWPGGEDYPTEEQVLHALNEANAFLAVVATDDVAPLYEDLIRNTVGTQRGYVARTHPDFSNFVDAAMESIGGRCGPFADANPEVVYLQDLTSSVRPYLETMQHEMPRVFRELQSYYPGSKFALAGYRDRPTFPKRSFYWLHHKLDASVELFESHIRSAFIPSARDCNEMSMQALLSLALDHSVGFSRAAKDSEGRVVRRAVIVAATGKPPPIAEEPTVASFGGAVCPFGNAALGLIGPMSISTNQEFTGYDQVAAELSNVCDEEAIALGEAPLHLAFGVPEDLMSEWHHVAELFDAYGLPSSVHPIWDVEGLVRAAADPRNRFPPRPQ